MELINRKIGDKIADLSINESTNFEKYFETNVAELVNEIYNENQIPIVVITTCNCGCGKINCIINEKISDTLNTIHLLKQLLIEYEQRLAQRN